MLRKESIKDFKLSNLKFQLFDSSRVDQKIRVETSKFQEKTSF